MFITFITSILYYIYAILLITIFILILIIFLAGLNEITVAAGITTWTNVNVHMYIYTTFDERTTKRRAGSPAADGSSEFGTVSPRALPDKESSSLFVQSEPLLRIASMVLHVVYTFCGTIEAVAEALQAD